MINPSMRTVNRIPLDSLWDERGDIEVTRGRYLSKRALGEMLREHPVEFYVADVGLPLRRVDAAKCYDFWRSEVKAHVVDDPESGFHLDAFPGEYAYVASEWAGELQSPIVLLEKHH
jgi:hypothetical protein